MMVKEEVHLPKCYSKMKRTEEVNAFVREQAAISKMGQVPRLDWMDDAGTQHSLTQSLQAKLRQE